jgi:predicted transcriptional regulator
MSEQDLLRLTAQLVAAYLVRKTVAAVEVPTIIECFYTALGSLEQVPAAPEARRVPAVAIGRSVTRDFIVCLEDGDRLRTLKRHLRARHNLTPDEYRARWSLSQAYPIVAPSYAEERARLAERVGLGSRRQRPVAADR